VASPNETHASWENSLIVWRAFENQKRKQRSQSPEIPRTLIQNPLVSELIFTFTIYNNRKLIPLKLVGSFVDFIPSRLGHSQALDDAVSCVCALYKGRQGHLSKRVFQLYMISLASVRNSLTDPDIWWTSETLCASILLQLCEASLHSPPMLYKMC
jgi:hypothetical protein